MTKYARQDRISCKEAADILGCTVPIVKAGIETGVLPIGAVIRPGGKDKRCTYLIYRAPCEALVRGDGDIYSMPKWVVEVMDFIKEFRENYGFILKMAGIKAREELKYMKKKGVDISD